MLQYPFRNTTISLYQNIRPSIEYLPEDLASIVTSCWKEDPNNRPNFTQIIHMLFCYLSTISPLGPVIPPQIFPSGNTVFPPESPGTSALMPAGDSSVETPSTQVVMDQQQPKGSFFFCLHWCYWYMHQGSIMVNFALDSQIKQYMKENLM